MNKYETVIDKLYKIPRGYQVVVLIESLDKVSWFVKELIPYLDKRCINYKLMGAAQTILLPGTSRSIKFVTIDTLDMLASPFLLENDFSDDSKGLSAVYDKDLQDYIVLDLPGEPHSFSKPINQDELMWITRVMRAERAAEGKKPTYELQGLPDNKALEFVDYTPMRSPERLDHHIKQAAIIRDTPFE